MTTKGHHGLLMGAAGPQAMAAVWLDPTDLSTLFQDAAGTVPVTADGDPVGRWVDKSGNGRNFTQSDNSKRPIYHTSGGKHWVETDGTSQWLVSAVGALSFSNLALFIAYRPLSGTSDYGNVIGVGHAVTHTSPYYRWNLLTRTSGGYNYGFHKNGAQTFLNAAGAAIGNDLVMVVGYSGMWSQTAGEIRYNMTRINGSVSNPGTSGTQLLTYPNNTPATIGAQVDGGGDRAKARIYGVLIANTAVSSQIQINAWESYLTGLLP